MRFKFRGASSVAIIAGFAGALPAWGQQADLQLQTVHTSQISGPQQAAAPAAPQQTQAPAAQPQSEPDRVVVTGSFIQGTPEDAALPVEVFTQEDLEAQGAPTALEFAKSLTISGPTSGESLYFGGGALTGSPSFNLRGIGADKTLTLLNGRRMSQNLSNIPSAAIARTEVLKDGAAVIYGADATGGVVNFITRDDFVGLEAKANYKYISGSDGDYGASILGGVGEGDTNFLWSVEWEHRSQLETEERDFSSLPYYINPAPWSHLTNLSLFTPRLAPTTPPNNTVAGEFGNPVVAALDGGGAGGIADYTPASCAAQGGVYATNSPVGRACYYNYWSYYNLVEEQDIYRAFAQLKTSISDNMDFHIDASYGQVKVPHIFASPSLPTTTGPARALGATNQYFVPSYNPFVTEFTQRAIAPGATVPWAQDTRNVGTAGYTMFIIRPLAHQGNLATQMTDGKGTGTSAHLDNQIWRVSAGIDGTLGDWAGALSDIGFNAGVTYNQSINNYSDPDALGFRLQQALNGFGGPNCSVPDLDATRFGTQNTTIGTSAAARAAVGCYYWNPFASSYMQQPELGLANPSSGTGRGLAAPAGTGGWENNAELTAWLFDQRNTETITSSITADLVFNGELPLELPGGPIGWAAGTQLRQIESREFVGSEFYNGKTRCSWPEQIPQVQTNPQFTGCTANEPGPLGFGTPNPPDYNDQQQYSFFGEASLPILDNLNFQAAVRREEFSGGLGATVYKVSGKWQVFEPLSLRGSYGTNFQAPALTLDPGRIQNIVRAYTRVSNAWLGGQEITRSDVEPETAKAWNVGAIWSSRGIGEDHEFRIILDYFNIETIGEIGQLATVDDIANAVFALPNTGAGLANCSHPLIGRVFFNDTPTSPNGACVQGQTKAGDLNYVQTEIGNGPGQSTAGLDFQIDYTLPVGPGTLGFGVTGTYTTKLETSAQTLDGFVVKPADDRLGFVNFNSVTFASPEWRVNGNINYNMDRHNARLGINYISGVTDERGPVTPPGGIGASDFGVEVDPWLTFDFTYLFDITENFRLTASVNNILDKNPPHVRNEFGYDSRIGNPLGRTFELGLKSTF